MPRWAPGLRNRIPTAFMPWIAAQYPTRREPATAHCSMLPHRVNRVVATTRPKTAMRADQWPYRPLVGTHRPDRHLRYRVHATGAPELTPVLTPALRRAR